MIKEFTANGYKYVLAGPVSVISKVKLNGVDISKYLSNQTKISWYDVSKNSGRDVTNADGTIDYATILFAHKDRYDDIKEGVVYKQGEVIYSEGTKAGNKVGGAQRHVHFEICAGKTTGSGWKKSPDGTWNLVKVKKRPLVILLMTVLML